MKRYLPKYKILSKRGLKGKPQWKRFLKVVKTKEMEKDNYNYILLKMYTEPFIKKVLPSSRQMAKSRKMKLNSIIKRKKRCLKQKYLILRFLVELFAIIQWSQIIQPFLWKVNQLIVLKNQSINYRNHNSW